MGSDHIKYPTSYPDWIARAIQLPIGTHVIRAYSSSAKFTLLSDARVFRAYRKSLRKFTHFPLAFIEQTYDLKTRTKLVEQGTMAQLILTKTMKSEKNPLNKMQAILGDYNESSIIDK